MAVSGTLVHFETLWRSLLKLKRKLTGETIEILKRKFDYRSTKTTTRFWRKGCQCETHHTHTEREETGRPLSAHGLHMSNG